MKLKCYFLEQLWDKTERGQWFELLKSKDRLVKSSKPADRCIQSLIEWTNLENAKVCILPMDWNYYYQRKKVNRALQFCQRVKDFGKTVLSYTGGDYGNTVPAP